MTMRAVPAVSDPVMLLAVVVVLVLAAVALVQLARRRARAAGVFAGVAVAIVVAYGAVDAGVGLASRPLRLAPGDVECFDDWCASMTGFREDRASETIRVYVRLENRGRGRGMRSDLARAYLALPGGARVEPRNGDVLQAFLEPGRPADVTLVFAAPTGVADARFVVAEGADGVGPATFEIGAQGSLLHARAGWPVAGAAGAARPPGRARASSSTGSRPAAPR